MPCKLPGAASKPRVQDSQIPRPPRRTPFPTSPTALHRKCTASTPCEVQAIPLSSGLSMDSGGSAQISALQTGPDAGRDGSPQPVSPNEPLNPLFPSKIQDVVVGT